MITIIQGSPREVRRELKKMLGKEAVRGLFTTRWVKAGPIEVVSSRLVIGDGWELVLCPDCRTAVVLS